MLRRPQVEQRVVQRRVPKVITEERIIEVPQGVCISNLKFPSLGRKVWEIMKIHDFLSVVHEDTCTSLKTGRKVIECSRRAEARARESSRPLLARGSGVCALAALLRSCEGSAPHAELFTV